MLGSRIARVPRAASSTWMPRVLRGPRGQVSCPGQARGSPPRLWNSVDAARVRSSSWAVRRAHPPAGRPPRRGRRVAGRRHHDAGGRDRARTRTDPWPATTANRRRGTVRRPGPGRGSPRCGPGRAAPSRQRDAAEHVGGAGGAAVAPPVVVGTGEGEQCVRAPGCQLAEPARQRVPQPRRVDGPGTTAAARRRTTTSTAEPSPGGVRRRCGAPGSPPRTPPGRAPHTARHSPGRGTRTPSGRGR